MLKIRDDSQNYTATVIKLPVKQPVQGLDNLVQVEVFGNTCLISKDSPTDALYLYFPAGTQINDPFLHVNSLYRETQLNADSTKKGFFEPNGRVKGLKLRGIISTGFVTTIDSLNDIYQGAGHTPLKEGDNFNELDGIEICRKYFVPGNTPGTPKGDKQAKVNNKLADLMIPNQFRFHGETAHLAKCLANFSPNDIIVITDKWHGSSCILSRVYVNNKLNWRQKLWNKVKFLPKFGTQKWGYIYSSGKPKSNLPKGIDGEWKNDGIDFYNADIWRRAYEDYKHALEDGISLYGELVGFTDNGAYIQRDYDYGCDPQGAESDAKDNYRFIIYRITYTKPNGQFIEFSWQQIKTYCALYGLEHAHELYFGRAGDFASVNEAQEFGDGLFETIVKEFIKEQDCKHCKNAVPAEGIVIRRDGHLTKYDVYKVKSKRFVYGETTTEESNIEDEQ